MDRRKDQQGKGDSGQKDSGSERPDPEASGDSEVSDQAPDSEQVEDDTLKWEHRTRFPMQDRMGDVIKQTIKASESQLALYRRKLRKMQYGS